MNLSLNKNITFCILLCSCIAVYGQGIKAKVDRYASSDFENVSLFSVNNRNKVDLSKELTQYQVMSLDKNALNKMLSSSDESILLNLPSLSRSNLKLKLVEVTMPYFNVNAAPSGKPIKYKSGKHYQGVVDGQNKSLAAVSIFEDEVYGLISEEGSESSLVLGKIDGKDEYVLYNDKDLKQDQNFKCDAETKLPYDLKDNEIFNRGGSKRALTDCVGLYIEVDSDIVNNKGGETGAINYITALYNQMAILYTNEQIKTKLSKVVVWTSTSPYTSNDAGSLLNQFTAFRNGFEGDLGMLVSYRGSGGIAYINGLCSFNKDFSSGYSGIGSSFANVPTYSWSVNVLAHEFGHLFGSPHTHDCSWNGNNTAIDGCGTPSGCANPGLPSGGGTIMSYCHTTTAGINFQKGFGEQPGNLMRSRVAAANCLSPCDINGGGTGGGTTCTSNTVKLDLVTDNYPGEITWQVTNSSGTILYSGGPYNTPFSLVSNTFCLPNGCYSFKINDSFGDGICCSQGQGNYKVLFNGTTLISGGQYNFTETKQFCVNGGTTTATCTDGVQNGQETGIDCGGPTCPACPPTNPCTNNTPPTVSLTKASQSFVAGSAPFVVTASASDNGSVTSVAFYNGSTLLGTDASAPYEYTIATSAASTYSITARATDNCGAITNSPAVNYTATATCSDGVKNGTETAIDCGGSCSPCATGGCITGTVTLLTDAYPGETNWRIVNAQGQTVVTSPAYNTAFSTVNTSICLSAGVCYTFIINDLFGDGICCSQGQGNYKIIFNGTTLISGGQFSITESKQFCVPSTGPSATCSDGIQNGQETGVDCGGPSCPACPPTNPCTNNTPPTVSLTKATQSFVAGSPPFVVTASASDNGIVTSVAFYNGSTLLGTDASAPYEYTITTSTAAIYSITARATDNCGAISNSPVVNYTATATCSDGVKNGTETAVDCGGTSCAACPPANPCTNNTPPVVSLTKASQSFVAGSAAFVVTASASDNGTVTSVAFYNGVTLLGTDATAPYEYSITTSVATTYNITARATDNCGAITNSPSVNYTATSTCSDGVKNGTETAIDCGGSCTPCNPSGCITGAVTILTDAYPGETNWRIINATGQTVISSPTYTSPYTTINTSICLPPGVCYTFLINDLFGDGICCSQGQGNYKVVFNGSTLITGGQFTTTESKSFCVPTNGTTSTCTDGIKNGLETGVDCGGPSCPVCPPANPCTNNTPPTVTLSKASQSFVAGGSSFTVTASASDNGTVTSVAFYNGATLLGTDLTAPYEYSFTSSVAATYSITARATDNCGAITNSAAVTYTATATCTDGVKNGTETAVDCGGGCTPCTSGGCVNGSIVLRTDAYPTETTWKITNAQGQTLYTNPSYTAANTEVTTAICLPAGQCYNFIISDWFADGICCSQGQGYYRVIFGGSILQSGGQFGFTETKNFCVNSTGNLIPVGIKTDSDYSIYPNPTSGALVIDWYGIFDEKQPIQTKIELYNLIGQRVFSQDQPLNPHMRINLEELPNGIYQMKVIKGDEVMINDKVQVIR